LFLMLGFSKICAEHFYFSYNGKVLVNNYRLIDMNIGHDSLIQLILRVCGGGGDGGATSFKSRDYYLNMYAKKKTKQI
jgi:hypothetical protein